MFAVYPAAMILALLLLGNLSEVVGARRAILVGLLLLALGAGAFLAASGLPLLLVGRASMGFGVGVGLGPATAVIAASARDGASAGTGRITTVATSVGLIGALTIGGASVEHGPDPLRSGFIVLLVTIAGAVLLALLLPRDAPAARQRWRPQPLALPQRPRPFVAGTLAIAAAYSLGAVFLGIGAQFAKDAVGSDDALVNGLVLAVSAASIGTVALVAGRLAPPLSLPLGAVSIALGQILMATAGVSHVLPLLIVSSIVGGAGYALIFSGGINLITASARPERRASVTSSAYLAGYLIQAIIALTLGAVATANGLLAGLLAGSVAVVMIAVAAAVVLHLVPLRRRHGDPRRKATTSS